MMNLYYIDEVPTWEPSPPSITRCQDKVCIEQGNVLDSWMAPPLDRTTQRRDLRAAEEINLGGLSSQRPRQSPH